MSPLVHAELMKLRTVWSTWAVLLVLPLVAVISLFDAALDPVEHNTSVADFMDVSLAVVAIAVAAFAAALVGSEFRRRLVGFDYLAVPRRVPVLAAKLIAFACVGALLGFLTILIAHVVVTPIALGRDVPAENVGHIAVRVVAVTAATAALGAFGSAIGVLVPNPAIAVGAIIGWQFVEGILGMAMGISDYLPIGLIIAVAHLGDTVALPLAFGLLLLYTAIVAAVAMLVGRRRDLTC
jgi:hypothetical protein